MQSKSRGAICAAHLRNSILGTINNVQHHYKKETDDELNWLPRPTLQWSRDSRRISCLERAVDQRPNTYALQSSVHSGLVNNSLQCICVGPLVHCIEAFEMIHPGECSQTDPWTHRTNCNYTMHAPVYALDPIAIKMNIYAWASNNWNLVHGLWQEVPKLVYAFWTLQPVGLASDWCTEYWHIACTISMSIFLMTHSSVLLDFDLSPHGQNTIILYSNKCLQQISSYWSEQS